MDIAEMRKMLQEYCDRREGVESCKGCSLYEFCSTCFMEHGMSFFQKCSEKCVICCMEKLKGEIWYTEKKEMGLKESCEKKQHCDACSLRELCENGVQITEYKIHKYGEVTEKETVNHPNHYTQGKIECIDAMEAAFGREKVADWCMMNGFKYIWRYREKNGVEDVKKAKWYIEKYLELVGE